MKRLYPLYLAFPFRIGSDGRTAAVGGLDEHVHDEIVQLILTANGERLFLPQFGTNVRRLIFDNLDDAVASLTKTTVANALSQWLGHRVHVSRLDVAVDQSTISVDLSYQVAGGSANHVRFQRELG
jgi:phage baseplate assembly protein W